GAVEHVDVSVWTGRASRCAAGDRQDYAQYIRWRQPSPRDDEPQDEGRVTVATESASKAWMVGSLALIRAGVDRTTAVLHIGQLQMRPVMMTCVIAGVGLFAGGAP